MFVYKVTYMGIDLHVDVRAFVLKIKIDVQFLSASYIVCRYVELMQ